MDNGDDARADDNDNVDDDDNYGDDDDDDDDDVNDDEDDDDDDDALARLGVRDDACTHDYHEYETTNAPRPHRGRQVELIVRTNIAKRRPHTSIQQPIPSRVHDRIRTWPPR